MGHILTAHGFRMGEDRMKAIGDLPTPETVKKLRSVLGMNFVFKYIPNLAGILGVTPPPKKEAIKEVARRWGPKHDLASFSQHYNEMECCAFSGKVAVEEIAFKSL